MKYKRLFFSVLVILFFLSHISLAQQPQEQNLDKKITVKPSVGAEYFSLTIGWDEDENTSKLKSYLLSTNTEIEIFDGFSVHVIFGYSLSNFDDLTFRQLPFSVEIGVKEIGGLLFGTEINKSLFNLSDYEISLQGQLIYYYGFNNEWELPDLNVDGTVVGTPNWTRAQIGPKISYSGFINISPFFSATYNKLWGTFKMEQEILDLSGIEEKKITGKSSLAFSAGSEFAVSSNLSVKGALSVMPYKAGVDIGGMISIQYVFQTQNRRTP